MRPSYTRFATQFYLVRNLQCKMCKYFFFNEKSDVLLYDFAVIIYDLKLLRREVYFMRFMLHVNCILYSNFFTTGKNKCYINKILCGPK